MDSLLAIDRFVFLSINHLPHTALTDWLAQFFSGAGTAGFIWVCIAVALFVNEEKKNHRFFLPIALALGASWLLVEQMLKYAVARPRPHVLDGALIISSASGFSFPSSHAAISWAMAVVMSRYEPRLRWVWYLLACVISFTRVYLGVHYPLDVIAGSVIGWGIGSMALRWATPRRKKSSVSRK